MYIGTTGDCYQGRLYVECILNIYTIYNFLAPNVRDINYNEKKIKRMNHF